MDQPEYLHVVWRIQRGHPPLSNALEQRLSPLLSAEAAQWGARVLAFSCLDDHVHLALRLPHARYRRPVLDRLKSASSAHVAWQKRDGVWALSRNQLPYALSYILCQKEHHQRGDLWPFWELLRRK